MLDYKLRLGRVLLEHPLEEGSAFETLFFSTYICYQFTFIYIFLDRPKNTMLTVSPSILTLNSNVHLTCSAVGKPNVANYKFSINGKFVGNATNGKLTLNASNCASYTGTYTCVPESSIGEGEKKSVVKEFGG